MKRIILILGSLFLGYAVFAHPADRYFDDDDYDDGDLYEWGVQINNYAAPYSDQFVIWAAREYNFPRNDLRYYLRKGYSPSDLLAGIELSRRSGYPLRAVMDYYRRGKDRNWINVSLHFGIGRSSADFRIILGRFREYSRYWNAYYAHRHPGRVPPPVYRHGWSYFRPDAPHRRPAPKPPRPVVRPPHPPRPQMPGNRPAVPPGHPVRPQRPSSTDRPQRPEYRPRNQKSISGRSARDASRRNDDRRSDRDKDRTQKVDKKENNKSYRR